MQPKDFAETDPNYKQRYYGGYAKAEISTGNGQIMKWFAVVLGSITAGAILFLVSCTFNKVDSLGGDMREVKAQLKISGEQYARDRDETDRRFRQLEWGPERRSEREGRTAR